MQRREHIAHGLIDSSLFGAASKAGMSNAMVLKLAEVFKFDIDFVQDLRVGDNFTVIYDDVYSDGAFLREGDIVAAEFVNQGKRYTAYRFKNSDGKVSYFSEEGRPLTGSFLRIPVDFTRISSQFSAGRMHPILGKMRAHKGVDYAAPSGTPIHAAGDGVVKFRGWMNGYGNFVVIQHNATISTAYGHMSRFANLRVGQRVSQGSTIGYVGMTGLATGPHLHYEFRVNNMQRDPQTVTLPKPEPCRRRSWRSSRRKWSALSSPVSTRWTATSSLRVTTPASTARTDPWHPPWMASTSGSFPAPAPTASTPRWFASPMVTPASSRA